MALSFTPHLVALTVVLALSGLFFGCQSPTASRSLLNDSITCSGSSVLGASTPVGRTSYISPPTQSDVYQQSWGASPGLAPTQLFWESTSFFNDNTQLLAARGSAANLEAQGIIPQSGAQMWEDTYAKSFPAGTYASGPGDGSLSSLPENQAWVNWIAARGSLLDVEADGGSAPYYFRSWGGNWGYVSPLTPLDAADWPSGISNATFGDWFARKWAQTATKSGAYGILLSDFVDSLPHLPTYQHGFNSRVIAAFESSIGTTIPGATVSAKATYINQNLFNSWNDFMGRGFGKFYAALEREIRSSTGKEPLIINQAALWPSLFRLRANDPRLILNEVNKNNMVFIWDTMTMSPEREGQALVYSIGMAPVAAAREPRARIGANMHSDDDNFWDGVAVHWSSLSSADRHERGLKELKRLWLEMEWAHIADENGDVRRAIAFTQKSYWDAGTMDTQVLSVATSIRPTKPFGYALYYSPTIERKVETYLAANNAHESGAYLSPNQIVNLKNTQRVPLNYFVSDKGLAQLKTSARPTAWIVVGRNHPGDGSDMLPASELAALQAIAPVLSTSTEISSFATSPLTFSSGTSGIGFIDQNDHLILTMSNLVSSSTSATVQIRGLSSGSYIATDLFTNQKITFNVSGEVGSLPATLTRWDTRAFGITTASGGGVSPSPTPTPTPAPAPSCPGI